LFLYGFVPFWRVVCSTSYVFYVLFFFLCVFSVFKNNDLCVFYDNLESFRLYFYCIAAIYFCFVPIFVVVVYLLVFCVFVVYGVYSVAFLVRFRFLRRLPFCFVFALFLSFSYRYLYCCSYIGSMGRVGVFKFVLFQSWCFLGVSRDPLSSTST